MKKVLLLTTLLLLMATLVLAQHGKGMEGEHSSHDGHGMKGKQVDCDVNVWKMKGDGHGCDKSGHGSMGMKGCGGHSKGGRRGAGALLAHAEMLELDDKQVAKIKKMAAEFPLAMVDLKADAKKAQIKLKTLMRDEDASEADVLSAIDKATAARASVKKAQYQHRTAMRDVLTAEQRDKLKSMRKNKRLGDYERVIRKEIIIEQDG